MTVPALDHPLVGELVRWSRDGNVLVGLAGGYVDDCDSIVLLSESLRDLSVLVPAIECRLAGAARSGELVDDVRTAAERDAYLRGLVDARSRVSLIAAELAMSGDVQRCAGVARAFAALDELVRKESGQ
ncbi:hypothetical protein ASE16_00340 [Leifsonia sp. Root227]|nr:hypothetical protein ASE16_00340 [Leifsonia sp. Root227]